MIVVDLESSVPLEEQITEGVRQAIARGDVAPGDPLPSVRQLAGDLGVHWNTVARAYRRLREARLLVVGRGRGVFVRRDARAESEVSPETRARVEQKIHEALTEAVLGGYSLDGFRECVEAQLRAWSEKGKGT
jgi:GntR family transcriptional regulator